MIRKLMMLVACGLAPAVGQTPADPVFQTAPDSASQPPPVAPSQPTPASSSPQAPASDAEQPPQAAAGAGATADGLNALLARIPAESAKARTELEAELLKLNAAQVKALCERLVEPGRGDDAKVRMAIHAVVLLAGRPDAAARRSEIESALIERIASRPPALVQDFLLEQLRFIASPACVGSVAGLLADEVLCPRTCLVLVTVGDASARAALRTALASAEDKTCLAILHALGQLGDAEALADLAGHADRTDVERWRVLAHALAAAGHPAMDALTPAMLGPTPGTSADAAGWYERSVERALALRYIRQGTSAAAPAEAAAKLRSILSTYTDAADVHLRCAALSILAERAGAEALPDVLAAMRDDDVELAGAAAEIAARIQDDAATGAMISALAAESPPVQARLLQILARRGDAAAFDACVGSLSSADPAVQLAAIAAAARLGGARAIPALTSALGAQGGELRAVAQQALFEMKGDEVSRRLAESLGTSPSAAKVGVLEVLARRRAADQLDTMFACAQDAAEEVSVAAFKALEAVAPASAVSRLLERFAATVSEDHRQAAGAAIAAACLRHEDPAGRAAPVIAALKTQAPAHLAELLRVLGRVGGSPALAAVREHLKSPQTEVREAAFAAVCDWPDAEGLAEAMNLARISPELKDHVLAIRGLLRMLDAASGLPMEDRLKQYATAIEASRRPDERKLAFSSVAKLADPRAIDVLRPYVLDPGAGAEASLATVQLADRLIPARCAEARSALTALQASALQDRSGAEWQPAVEALSKTLEKLAKFEDHITDWHVSGPYTQKDKRGQDILDTPFAPEDPKAKGVIWREQPPAGDPAMAWAADLNLNPWLVGNMRAAYLHTRVYSPAAQSVRLEVGSDDGVKVWLNGECVHTNNALRGSAPGQDSIPVMLKEGWNDLLLKVTNDGGGWVGAARFRGANGEHLEGVYARRGFAASEPRP